MSPRPEAGISARELTFDHGCAVSYRFLYLESFAISLSHQLLQDLTRMQMFQIWQMHRREDG